MYTYNNPSAPTWGSSQPTADQSQPGLGARRFRSSTAPPLAQHPALHVPPTIHRSDLFFTNGPSTTSAESHTPPYSPPDATSVMKSYLARSLTSPPPIPPKPSLSPPALPPTLPPKLPFPSYPSYFPRVPNNLPSAPPAEVSDLPPSPSKPGELEAALALSRSESSQQAAFLEKLTSQEEDDLNRALEESMRVSMNSYTSTPIGSPEVYTTFAGSSRDATPNDSQADQSSIQPSSNEATDIKGSGSWGTTTAVQSDMSGNRTHSASVETPRHSANSLRDDGWPLSSTQISDDEALARKLAAEEEAREHETIGPAQPDGSPAGIDPTAAALISADEILARQLAAEEEEEAQKIRAEDGGPAPSPVPIVNAPPAPSLPTYDDAVSPKQSPLPSATEIRSSLSADSTLFRSNSSASSSASFVSSIGSQYQPSPSRPVSADVESFSSSSSLPAASSVSLSTVSETSEDESTSSVPTQNHNQYVDKELLHGISVGFTGPMITASLQPMQGVMPNIISLPYGRCPPLHLHAPNWRHLLKLMAWLSNTRIEPTVEAMAVTKADNLHLRTVIQFVKPHHASSDWRTVVWFTIDHPVPTSMPGARKYLNGDVDMLPWSYTLSTLPGILKDGSDTPLSKTYTIPATDSMPYPPLPITFPNLAMYLQAALDESRRFINDSSSGIRKLAKMIDTCYPETNFGAPSDRGHGVGGLFKKVIGRSNKNNKKGRGGNEDTYQLVTPFVPDQWG